MYPHCPQIPFRIQRGHATAAGGAYCLTVYLVLNIAAGKYAGDICTGRIGLSYQVALLVHIQ